jgi:hypothetical protein
LTPIFHVYYLLYIYLVKTFGSIKFSVPTQLSANEEEIHGEDSITRVDEQRRSSGVGALFLCRRRIKRTWDCNSIVFGQLLWMRCF